MLIIINELMNECIMYFYLFVICYFCVIEKFVFEKKNNNIFKENRVFCKLNNGTYVFSLKISIFGLYIYIGKYTKILRKRHDVITMMFCPSRIIRIKNNTLQLNSTTDTILKYTIEVFNKKHSNHIV